MIANALPALERGIFREGWSLNYRPEPPQNIDDFYDRVYERVMHYHSPPRSIAGDVFWLLKEKLPQKLAEAIRQSLPPALVILWPDETTTETS